MEPCIHQRLARLERDRVLVTEALAALRGAGGQTALEAPSGSGAGQDAHEERELRALLAAMDEAEARLLAVA